MTFPFEDQILLSSKKTVRPELVIDVVGPLLTPERREKIDRVIAQRTFNCAIVLENIYDRGNASAVLRTAEGLGFGSVHSIEWGLKFKESQRTTAGADKWVELKRWKKTSDCVADLRKQGMQIVATHLDNTSKKIDEIDFSKPTAFVLGNEKDGISSEMIEAADHRVLLPMVGFVQSYNISVAAAIGLYHIFLDRQRRLGTGGDLSESQKQILRAHYYLRTQSSAESILDRVLSAQ